MSNEIIPIYNNINNTSYSRIQNDDVTSDVNNEYRDSIELCVKDESGSDNEQDNVSEQVLKDNSITMKENDSILLEENEPMIPSSNTETVKPKPERVYWIDFLRVIACFLVVLTHCSIKYLTVRLKIGSYNWKVLTVYNALARPCVPFFIMISGTFFLNPQKNISFKTMYTKYIFRILKGFIFWSLFYNIVERYIVYYNPKNELNMDLVKYTLTRIFLADEHALWYLNFVMGLYILTPIFKVITTNRPVTWYAVIIFSFTAQLIPTICNTLQFVYGITGLAEFIQEYINTLYLELAGNYATYYLLGYLLSTQEFAKKRYIYLSYLVSVAGFVFTLILRFKSSYFTKKNDGHFVEFYSFNVIMYTMGLFVFFRCVVSRWLNPFLNIDLFKKFLMSLSECSFGIYLIHMFILQAFNKKLNFHVQLFDPLYWTPIYTLIVFFTCYIIIYLLRKISFFRVIT